LPSVLLDPIECDQFSVQDRKLLWLDAFQLHQAISPRCSILGAHLSVMRQEGQELRVFLKAQGIVKHRRSFSAGNRKEDRRWRRGSSVEWNGASSTKKLQDVGNNEGAENADCIGRQVILGTIDGERNVSEKQTELKTLIEKMRTNTDKQNRKTEALPLRRFRKKMQRARQTDGAEKQK
jgi:hypothetical protein